MIKVKVCAELPPLSGVRVGDVAIVGAGTPQEVRATLLLLGISPSSTSPGTFS